MSHLGVVGLVSCNSHVELNLELAGEGQARAELHQGLPQAANTQSTHSPHKTGSAQRTKRSIVGARGKVTC